MMFATFFATLSCSYATVLRFCSLCVCSLSDVELNVSLFRQRTFQTPAGFCLLGIWARLFSARKPESSDEVLKLISSARVLVTDKKYEEAAEVLHEALKKAQEQNDQNAINYIYDFLANIYYYLGDLEKAKAVFIDLMSRLLSSGTPKTDCSIVEISLKLADIYVQEGDLEKAEAGFKFCVETQKRNVEQAEQAFLAVDTFGKKSIDIYALYGMVLETYAGFLVSTSRVEEGVECINRALELAREVYSPLHPQIVTILNNFGCKCLQHRHFETAKRYISEAVKRAQMISELAHRLPSYYCNYAEALWHCGEQALALETTKKAAKVAEELKDEETLSRVNEYLASLVADVSR
ncbi:unnamed protein product [Soboliphyme baturini]|uniref:Tetratricopeptide repeat protein 19, mitochondrial n=1 Tax=Soboliphyme baturini TaxID=241478 RepID=A0A183ITU6_9BILA|nr:unnamed protein product [Soboliphyme baturini]